MADQYDVRCFRRKGDGDKRHGLWVMTQEARGLFVHGKRDEFQTPRYSISELDKWATIGGFIDVEEITPEQVLAELDDWPEGRAEVLACFERHRKAR